MNPIAEIFNRPRGRERRYVNLAFHASPSLVGRIRRSRSGAEAADLVDELLSIVNRSRLPDLLRLELFTWLMDVSPLAREHETEAACFRKPEPRQTEFPWAV